MSKYNVNLSEKISFFSNVSHFKVNIVLSSIYLTLIVFFFKT